MQRMIGRRLVAACGALGAGLVFAAAPAAAAAPDVVAVAMRDVTVAIDHPGVVAGLIVLSDQPLALDDVAVTYDFTELAGVAEVVAQSPACSLVDTTVLACRSDHLELGAQPLTGAFDVVVRAAKGSPGGEGGLEISFAARDVSSETASSWVRVGPGVDLVAGPSSELSRAPGETFALPLRVEVAGDTPVERPSVFFTDTYALRPTRTFTNCLYVEKRIQSCTFDDALPAGATYSAMMPFLVGADTAAPDTRSIEATWMTQAESEDFARFLSGHGYSGGEPGTEGELTLTGELALRSSVQADTEPRNNSSAVSVTVTGRNAYDVAAVGAQVRGEVGAVRPLTLGFHNAGPAALESAGADVALVDVTIPSGTTVTVAPPECAPLVDGVSDPFDGGAAGAAAYRCSPGSLVYPDFTVNFVFELRIDRARPAEGTILISGAGDRDAANNRAAIVVNGPTPTQNRPAPPPAATGSLPITGAPAGRAAGLGVLLIVVGASAVAVARRRATG
jgi:hypothetical protein